MLVTLVELHWRRLPGQNKEQIRSIVITARVQPWANDQVVGDISLVVGGELRQTGKERATVVRGLSILLPSLREYQEFVEDNISPD